MLVRAGRLPFSWDLFPSQSSLLFSVAMPIATAPIEIERTVVELLATIVLWFSVVALPTVSTVRSYFRDLDTM